MAAGPAHHWLERPLGAVLPQEVERLLASELAQSLVSPQLLEEAPLRQEPTVRQRAEHLAVSFGALPHEPW
jgi:hypothetical protein